jgi:hypothetical protein
MRVQQPVHRTGRGGADECSWKQQWIQKGCWAILGRHTMRAQAAAQLLGTYRPWVMAGALVFSATWQDLSRSLLRITATPSAWHRYISTAVGDASAAQNLPLPCETLPNTSCTATRYGWCRVLRFSVSSCRHTDSKHHSHPPGGRCTAAGTSLWNQGCP